MALPVSSETAAEAYAVIRRHGRQAYALAQDLQGYLSSGSVLASFLLDVATQGASIVVAISGVRATPGLADYTRTQLGVAADVDVGADLTASVIALAQLAGTIRAEYPKDAEGFLRDRQFQADGQLVFVSIPATALPGTSAALANFLATLA